MLRSFATMTPVGPEIVAAWGGGGLQYHVCTKVRCVPTLPWILQAFDSRQNSGDNYINGVPQLTQLSAFKLKVVIWYRYN